MANINMTIIMRPSVAMRIFCLLQVGLMVSKLMMSINPTGSVTAIEVTRTINALCERWVVPSSILEMRAADAMTAGINPSLHSKNPRNSQFMMILNSFFSFVSHNPHDRDSARQNLFVLRNLPFACSFVLSAFRTRLMEHILADCGRVKLDLECDLLRCLLFS